MINAPLSTATFPHRFLTILEKALGTRAIYSDFQEEKTRKNVINMARRNGGIRMAL